jgi:hypothetical protein
VVAEIPISDHEILRSLSMTGSMVQTGQDLGLSPAAVSRCIAALEEKLQKQLFHRPVMRLELTAAGRLFYYQLKTDLPHLGIRAHGLIQCSAANDNGSRGSSGVPPAANK